MFLVTLTRSFLNERPDNQSQIGYSRFKRSFFRQFSVFRVTHGVYVGQSLRAGESIEADSDQFNYLANVLRMGDGAEILLFNGRDGEWKANLSFPTRKKIMLVPLEETRPQPEKPDLHYIFAPLKTGRLDYLVQKAVEMGAGVLRPVLTQHVQGKITNLDKLRAKCHRGCGTMRYSRRSACRRTRAG